MRIAVDLEPVLGILGGGQPGIGPESCEAALPTAPVFPLLHIILLIINTLDWQSIVSKIHFVFKFAFKCHELRFWF